MFHILIVNLSPSHVSSVTFPFSSANLSISRFKTIFPSPLFALRIYVGIARPDVLPRSLSYILMPSAKEIEKCLVPAILLG